VTVGVTGSTDALGIGARRGVGTALGTGVIPGAGTILGIASGPGTGAWPEAGRLAVISMAANST
jgi:hypothetical protein